MGSIPIPFTLYRLLTQRWNGTASVSTQRCQCIDLDVVQVVCITEARFATSNVPFTVTESTAILPAELLIVRL